MLLSATYTGHVLKFEHLNDYFGNIGPTLAAESECLSDYEDLHCNSTDVNSKFYFHTITGSIIF